MTQLLDVQSPFAPHADPGVHMGEHEGTAQVSPVHTPEPQLPSSRQVVPSLHVGAHEGAHVPLVQTSPIPQSVPSDRLLQADVAIAGAQVWHAFTGFDAPAE
jgi:hypothetical protein